MESVAVDQLSDLQMQIDEAQAQLNDLDSVSRELRTILRQKDHVIDTVLAAQADHPTNDLDVELNRLKSAVATRKSEIATLTKEVKTLEGLAHTHEVEIVRLMTAEDRDGRRQLADESRAIEDAVRQARAQREALNGLSQARTEALAALSDRIKTAAEIVRVHSAPRAADAASHLAAVGARAVGTDRARQLRQLALLQNAETAPERPQSPGRAPRVAQKSATIGRSRTPVRGARAAQRTGRLYTDALPVIATDAETAPAADFDALVAEAKRLRALVEAAESAEDARTDDVESLQTVLCKAETALARVARRELVLAAQFEQQEVEHAAALAALEEAHTEETSGLREQLDSVRQQLINAYN